ncbi:phosphatidate cytidylyltransferase [Glaciibacter psychrotolerans]|uniref:Phosphatidate cytidylyltransferase n=1 Tax=Glaciibacter psychrotolerans TaxID=670054 RepID=A0A7Z0J5F6_9MICO|nr:phosphatidate cytidylyltransferase [Leifsonia psychrotolerans]NYJ19432.1 phosphatidate cytidylyltransferase [Leifsonia psychrotolerans]
MVDDPQGGRPHRRGHGVTRAEFRAQVRQKRADVERQVHATRAQIDATNARIEARTGRNLILAILIGLVLGLALVGSLIFIKELFMAFAVVIVGFTAFEFVQALRHAGRNVPPIPVVIAAISVVPAAFYWDAPGQWLTLLGGIAFIALWRVVEMAWPSRRVPPADMLKDIGGGFLVQVYVVFLASFSVLLTTQPGGEWWTLAFILLVVSADTGAYVSGLNFGKHKMAPTISPKKTWEGFLGAVLACLIVGVLLALFMLGEPWWFGLIFGAVMVLTATFGDLAESLIKRDLGIKDMSSWLPGHGGFLDRLDSILPSAAAAYALYLIFA